MSAASTGGPLLDKATRGTIVWPGLSGKPTSKWLWSRNVDMLLIGGVGSLLFAAVAVPLSLLWPGANVLILTGFLHIGVLCNYPHYAATYHLIYRERQKQPRNWNWLLVSIPMALVALGAGIAKPWLLGPLVRLYLTWSAWHYAAQHFGVACMYSARDGRVLQDREKRVLLFGFGGVSVSMMIVANSENGVGSENPFGAALYGKAIALLPEQAYWASLVVAAVATGAAVLAHRMVKARTGRGLDSTVWTLFLVNVAWFVLPYPRLPGAHGPWMGQLAMWVAFFPPFFHCAQYLGVSGWRARTSGSVKPIYAFMTLVFIGLLLFEGVTALVPRVTSLSHEEALMLIPPILNVHHFFIDGIIWRRPKNAAGPNRPVAGVAQA